MFLWWECPFAKDFFACLSLQTADQQYQEAFNDELESFKERVRGRAKIRIEKAMKEYEEEEKQKRVGPGGLDPVEVYEALPLVSFILRHSCCSSLSSLNCLTVCVCF